MYATRRARYVGAIAAFAAVSIGGGAVAWSATQSSTPTVTQTNGGQAAPVPSGLDVPALTRLVQEVASESGDLNPISAQAVLTDRAKVLAAVGDSDGDASPTPVIDVQIRGHFTVSSPAGGKAGTATVLEITYTPDLKQVLDVGVKQPGNRITDLSTLGNPVDVPLS